MKNPAKNIRWVKGFLTASLCILMLLMADINAASAEAKSAENPLLNYLVLRGGPGRVDDIHQSAGSMLGADLITGSEYGINFAYGHRFLKWLRVEFELGYVDMEVENLLLKGRGTVINSNGSDKQFNGMLNAYADWKNTTSFTPFIGGGFGLARAKLDLTYRHPGTGNMVSTKNTDYPLAYQFMAGVAWAFHPAWQLELLYKYYGTNDTKRDNPGGTFPEHNIEGISASFIELGVRYNF